MPAERGDFKTKLGIILATAGSAVGLGNIWRFPYMTGQDGGAAFILVYIACVLMLGIPGVISEFIVGRHASANAVRAYRNLGNGRPWHLLGMLGILTSTIILGFYAVVAGWCLQYLYAAITAQLSGDAQYVVKYFHEFSTNPVRPTLWAVAFILITHTIVVKGVRNGIEKASNMMMPTLFVLLLVIVVAACTLPGSMEGVKFLFKPDFSKLTHNVFLDALGQAFFSLSLGTACLCTYASYFSRQTNLAKSACQIALLDTLIAILAGLMIFPAAFSVGVKPDSGPALIFITLPSVFQQAFGAIPLLGYVIGILFYAMLSLAALTSTISMHEIGTAYFYEEYHITRRKGAWIQTAIGCTLTIACSLSMGDIDGLHFFGKSFLDWCDFVTGQIMLPTGAFFTCIFVGWYIPKKIVVDEFTNWGTLRGTFLGIYLFAVRFVCPLCILAVFFHQLGFI
uniref:Sodium-dependent transporter n=1 Tax=Prevotella sp. GTC17254 TaxID=3236794 RepID=A0AB33J4E8_9BACT